MNLVNIAGPVRTSRATIAVVELRSTGVAFDNGYVVSVINGEVYSWELP